MANSKYQKFTVERIDRSQIKNAEYNPRIMDDEAKKRLKKGLQKHGLVSTLTWNKRTGNLVGGHQRLEQLDALEKNKNYSLDVCVIDVDEREEALLNVQLNNPSMQGDWDLDRLALMTEEFGIGFDDMGFSQLDVDFMFDGDERFTQLEENSEEAKKAKGVLGEIKEARAAAVESMAEKNSAQFYTVIVFEDEAARAEFHRAINVPQSEEFITLDKVMRIKNKGDL